MEKSLLERTFDNWYKGLCFLYNKIFAYSGSFGVNSSNEQSLKEARKQSSVGKFVNDPSSLIYLFFLLKETNPLIVAMAFIIYANIFSFFFSFILVMDGAKTTEGLYLNVYLLHTEFVPFVFLFILYFIRSTLLHFESKKTKIEKCIHDNNLLYYECLLYSFYLPSILLSLVYSISRALYVSYMFKDSFLKYFALHWATSLFVFFIHAFHIFICCLVRQLLSSYWVEYKHENRLNWLVNVILGCGLGVIFPYVSVLILSATAIYISNTPNRKILIEGTILLFAFRVFGALFTKFADINSDYNKKASLSVLKSNKQQENLTIDNPMSFLDSLGDLIGDSFGYIVHAIALVAIFANIFGISRHDFLYKEHYYNAPEVWKPGIANFATLLDSKLIARTLSNSLWSKKQLYMLNFISVSTCYSVLYVSSFVLHAFLSITYLYDDGKDEKERNNLKKNSDSFVDIFYDSFYSLNRSIGGMLLIEKENVFTALSDISIFNLIVVLLVFLSLFMQHPATPTVPFFGYAFIAAFGMYATLVWTNYYYSLWCRYTTNARFNVILKAIFCVLFLISALGCIVFVVGNLFVNVTSILSFLSKDFSSYAPLDACYIMFRSMLPITFFCVIFYALNVEGVLVKYGVKKTCENKDASLSASFFTLLFFPFFVLYQTIIYHFTDVYSFSINMLFPIAILFSILDGFSGDLERQKEDTTYLDNIDMVGNAYVGAIKFLTSPNISFLPLFSIARAHILADAMLGYNIILKRFMSKISLMTVIVLIITFIMVSMIILALSVMFMYFAKKHMTLKILFADIKKMFVIQNSNEQTSLTKENKDKQVFKNLTNSSIRNAFLMLNTIILSMGISFTLLSIVLDIIIKFGFDGTYTHILASDILSRYKNNGTSTMMMALMPLNLLNVMGAFFDNIKKRFKLDNTDVKESLTTKEDKKEVIALDLIGDIMKDIIAPLSQLYVMLLTARLLILPSSFNYIFVGLASISAFY